MSFLFYNKKWSDFKIPKKGQRSGYIVKCEFCGKEIYQTKTQYNRAKHHFCSNRCQKDFQHIILFEDRKCEICGKLFHVSKKSHQRFCSIKCQGKWQSTQTGTLNPRSKKIEAYCDTCGKKIYIIPYNKKRFEYHFCSNKCRRSWYSTVFSQDEEWKDISRKRAVNILNSKQIDTNTKPQIIINNLLDSMCIKYRNEENFIYYSIDNYLFEYNLVIEVMGDFWHCNPQKYSIDKIREIQKKRIPKDKAKHTFIRNKYGIEILYLWESDIYNNIFLCGKLIKNYINNNGVLKNYHSFNYHIIDNEIQINDSIIIPYQDMKIV